VHQAAAVAIAPAQTVKDASVGVLKNRFSV
jgi:hypothetical protein